jgi:hypothetical protein
MIYKLLHLKLTRCYLKKEIENKTYEVFDDNSRDVLNEHLIIFEYLNLIGVEFPHSDVVLNYDNQIKFWHEWNVDLDDEEITTNLEQNSFIWKPYYLDVNEYSYMDTGIISLFIMVEEEFLLQNYEEKIISIDGEKELYRVKPEEVYYYYNDSPCVDLNIGMTSFNTFDQDEFLSTWKATNRTPVIKLLFDECEDLKCVDVVIDFKILNIDEKTLEIKFDFKEVYSKEKIDDISIVKDSIRTIFNLSMNPYLERKDKRLEDSIFEVEISRMMVEKNISRSRAYEIHYASLK